MAKKIIYIEHGPVHDFKRRDYERKVVLEKTWEPEGTSLLYGYKDRYNVVSIAKEDIISIEEV